MYTFKYINIHVYKYICNIYFYILIFRKVIFILINIKYINISIYFNV